MILKLLLNIQIYMDGIYKNIEEQNPNKKRKTLITFDDIIADMLSNKKLNPVVTELFIRGRRLNISLPFVAQSYFTVPKKYQTKFYALFYHENPKQMRTSTNCI